MILNDIAKRSLLRCFNITSAQLCNKIKKCGAHTHAHQLSPLLSQYSRWLLSILARQTPQTKKNNCGFVLSSRNYFVCGASSTTLLFICTVVHKKREKCGAHTHVHQLSLFSSQYSRRLLSILAQQNSKQFK